ncbi:hypothetical protein PTKIN_Ptkin16aG0507200 [Pterospermum kingtungense]
MSGTMMQNNITVIYVRKKMIQTIGFIIVQFVIILFIQNVLLDNIPLLEWRWASSSRVDGIRMVMIYFLPKHLMRHAHIVIGLAKM